MTRTILATLAAAALVTAVAGTGCQSTGVGDPCIPEAEYLTSFLGFSFSEVNVESKSFQCQTRLCLANHFQGRVTCPYGQNSTGTAAGTASFDGTHTGCFTPINKAVDGIDSSGTVETPPAGGVGGGAGPGAVYPNCTDRIAENAVYCSCRCANIDGSTGDGANYCKCPTGFACTQLVSSIGNTETGLTGAYCVKNGTEYDPVKSCGAACTATNGGCGAAQGVSK
jgi:hypothetical protein